MTAFLIKYFPNAYEIRGEFLTAIWETLYMTFLTAIIGGILGIFIGVLLVVTDKKGILPQKVIYQILDKIVDIGRSIPFIILLAVLFPVTRFFAHTTIGSTAAIVPLVFGIVPFFARQIQNALLEIDSGVIEAAQAMGTSPLGIIFRIYLFEGLPSIIRASSLTIINLIGLTAMAGVVGAGGIGNLAISQGYDRFKSDVTIASLIIILLLVFVCQLIANLLLKKFSHDN